MMKVFSIVWPTNEPSCCELEAMGSVLAVMIRAVQLDTCAFMQAPDDDCVAEAARDSRPLLPPMLTHDAFAEAAAHGVRIRADAVQADICEIVGAFEPLGPADGNHIMHMTRLTLEMIRASFTAMVNPAPPLLDLEQAAHLIRIAPATLSRLVSQGRITKSVKRGKPLVFFRDVLVQEWMCP